MILIILISAKNFFSIPLAVPLLGVTPRKAPIFRLNITFQPQFSLFGTLAEMSSDDVTKCVGVSVRSHLV